MSRALVRGFVLLYFGALIAGSAYELHHPHALGRSQRGWARAAQVTSQLQGPPAAWLFAPEPQPLYWHLSVCVRRGEVGLPTFIAAKCIARPFASYEGTLEDAREHGKA